MVERVPFYYSSEIVYFGSFPHFVGSVIMEYQISVIYGKIPHNNDSHDEENNAEAHANIGPLDMFITFLIQPQIVPYESIISQGLYDTGDEEQP